MTGTAWHQGLHKRAVAAVEQTLAPGEQMRLVINGASNQAIIATDRRPLVYKKGFMAGATFGSELTRWAYRNLVGVQIHTGMMSGAVVLQGPGQTGGRTSYWKDDDSAPHKAPNANPLTRSFDAVREQVAELGRIIDEAHRQQETSHAGIPASASESLADEFAGLKAKLLT